MALAYTRRSASGLCRGVCCDCFVVLDLESKIDLSSRSRRTRTGTGRGRRRSVPSSLRWRDGSRLQ
eukprot:3987341-Prymnesium_polylepis.1